MPEITEHKGPKIIALYLPQYYPFKENDEWWGKGFTEWTNVARAKPMFKGHHQPNIPSELGFYDLRLPIIREQQAKLAKEAGIYGFCYWHYWFGNGKRLMQEVIDDIIESGKPDMPYCLGWANHSWQAKNWNIKDSKKDKVLIEQTYPGAEDIRRHYEYVSKAFKDKRYIKVNNMPLYMVFLAEDMPKDYIVLWNKWAKEDGFDGIYFIGNIKNKEERHEIADKMGYQGVIMPYINDLRDGKRKVNLLRFINDGINRRYFHVPTYKFNYKDILNQLLDPAIDCEESVIPSIIPNFDHSPRSGQFGLILHNSTPELFKIHAKEVLRVVKEKKNQIIFLRSWNEWGEGNYMEPDLRNGNKYILALRDAIKEVYKE